MLRSPLVAFEKSRKTAVAVVAGLAVALWMIAALGSATIQLQQGAQSWWDQFVPVVYLEGQLDGQSIDEVRTEIEGWSEVASVEIEDSEQMLDALQGYLGEQEVQQMGVESSMMPTALTVYPHLWRPTQVELMARLEALEVRSAVIAVDAPQAGALAWMARGQKVLVGLIIAVFLGLLAALASVVLYLRRLQTMERRENHLMEVFGATPAALRRPTIWRGMVLGGAAGAMAAIAFLVWSLIVDRFVIELVGIGAFSAMRAALWAGILVVVGVVLGGCTGWVCARLGEPHKLRTAHDRLDYTRDAP